MKKILFCALLATACWSCVPENKGKDDDAYEKAARDSAKHEPNRSIESPQSR
jgi:hypothetical protein